MSRKADVNKAEKFAKEQDYFLPCTAIAVFLELRKVETR